MKQRYKHILGLFVHLGYIFSKNKKITTFVTTKLDYINDNFPRHTFQVTSTHSKDKFRKLYVCNSIPTYKGPLYQQKCAAADRIGYDLIPFPDRYESTICNILRNYIRNINP